MELERAMLSAMIHRSAEKIETESEALCALDLAIGDGDHGANMKRGWDAVRAKATEIAALPTGEALSAIGRTLVMTVGGASGPLYGSFFLAAGATLERGCRLPEDLVEVVAAGVDAVGARGRSKAGEKTMLDVLIPVLAVLRAEGRSLPPHGIVSPSSAASGWKCRPDGHCNNRNHAPAREISMWHRSVLVSWDARRSVRPGRRKCRCPAHRRSEFRRM